MRIRVIDVLEMLANNVPAAQILDDFPDLEGADISSLLFRPAAPGTRASWHDFWLDAQLPPGLARHLAERFGVETKTWQHWMRDLDREIFNAAKRMMQPSSPRTATSSSSFSSSASHHKSFGHLRKFDQ